MILPASITDLPCWQGPVAGAPLKGGLSNEIWKVTDAAGQHVVRLGRDYPFHHVFRDREAMVARAAADAGFAPAVEHVGPGVMVTQFVTAQTLDPAAVCARPDQIGRLLRRFHDDMPARVSGPAYLFWPFHVNRDYERLLGLSRWAALNAALERMQPPLPIIFGHHDLLPANFLDDGTRLWLIDFEYAGFGTCLFDLAGVAANAGMDRRQEQTLMAAYFGTSPDATMGRAFDAMKLAALLREMQWAQVSGLHMAAPGVDYAAYAAENRARLMAELDQFQSLHGKLTP